MFITDLELTPGERLLVWRRREWLSQPTAAQYYGVSTSTYRRYENDEYGICETPYLALTTLEPHEKCVIVRRRSGLTQAGVAQSIGRSRWYVNLVENGQLPTDLVADFLRIQ